MSKKNDDFQNYNPVDIAKKYYDEAIEYVEKEMVKNIFPFHRYLYNYSDLLALLDNKYFKLGFTVFSLGIGGLLFW